MKEKPLISCLCVTNNKVKLISRAINCFESQTYENKELIIVYEDNDSHIRDYLDTIKNPDIRTYELSSVPKLSLGELRNFSINVSKGSYFCQWDADDWYHNKRLEVQFDFIEKMHKPVCFLTYWLIHDSLTKKSYLSRKRIWEGSILCNKERVMNGNVNYPSLKKEEDFYFVEQLIKENHVYPIDMPHLYIYVYHGENTWDYDHFKLNFKAGKELSESASSIIEGILERKYTNEEASELLDSELILNEIEYDYNLV